MKDYPGWERWRNADRIKETAQITAEEIFLAASLPFHLEHQDADVPHWKFPADVHLQTKTCEQAVEQNLRLFLSMNKDHGFISQQRCSQAALP